MKRLLALGLLAGLACSAAQAAEEGRNMIAAIVNEAIITAREIQEHTLATLDILYRTYPKDSPILAQKSDEAFADQLEQLVERQLILDDFKKTGIVLPEDYIEDEVKEKIRKVFGDRASLLKHLKEQGQTFETFRKTVRDDWIVDQMRRKNIASVLIISPQKIERYYATNLNNFRLDDQVKLRMIVVNRSAVDSVDEVKRLAREIDSKIDQGASFAEMASVYSTGLQQKEGGDWGWVERKVLKKGLSDLAFSLTPGKSSGVIAVAQQDNAYWVYQYDKAGQIVNAKKYTGNDAFLEERKGAAAADPALPPPNEFRLMLVESKSVARVKGLPEMRDEIERILLGQEREQLRQKWISRLKTKAFVRYF